MGQITINFASDKSILMLLLQYFSPILGVLIGFLLSIGWDYLKSYKEYNKKRKAIIDELNTNIGLIPQKVNVIEQIKKSLSEELVLPGNSVSFSSHIYHNYIGDITSGLSKIERENFHVIYQRLKIVDLFLDEFFEKYKQDKESSAFRSLNEDYKNTCDDIIESCLVSQHLIECLIDGKPKKITWEKVSSEKQLKYIKDYLLHHIYIYIKNQKVVTTNQVNKNSVPSLDLKSTYVLLQTLENKDNIIKQNEEADKDIAEYKWKFVK